MAYKFNRGVFKVAGTLNMSGSTDIIHKAGTVDNADLAGSIADSKLATISTAGKVDIGALEIDGASEMGAALADADLFIVDDGANGTEKSMLASRIPTYVFNKVSGDATIASGGALTIASDAVEPSMINILDDSLAATTTHFLIADGTDYSSFALSGDITCTNAGVVTIANDAVEQAMIADDAVGADQLASNAVVNASVASNAAIAFTKLAALASGNLLVGNGSNAAASVAMSGDVAISNAGVTTIQAGAVDYAMIASAAIKDEDNMASNSASHLATQQSIKAYVDSVAQGLDVKDSVKVATTANITLSGTQTIDGVAISADERVLVKNQSTGSENGIYLCKAGSWSRVDDLDTGADAAGAFCFVEQGSVAGNNGFVCTSDKGSAAVGTNSLAWSQFNGAGDITAGNAMTKSGNTLHVAVDDSSIEVNSDALRVKAGGITNAMLADDAVGADELASNAVVNASVASGAAIAFSKLAALTSTQILVGNGSNVPAAVAVSGDATLANNGALTMASSQSNINSLLATDLVIGEDAQTKIDFGNPNEIQFRANNTVTVAIEENKVQIMSGAFRKKVQTIGSGASASNSDSISATAGAMVLIFPDASKTFTLPAVSGLDGAVFMIKNAAADGGNSFTLAVQSGEKLDGSTNGTATLEGQASISCVVAGVGGDASWWIF